MTGRGRQHQCGRRHHGLAGTHITLDQAAHRALERQVGADFVDDPGLGRGRRKRQIGDQFRHQLAAIVE